MHVTRATIDALRKAGAISMALTGGSDTRFLLAACRDIATKLEFVTVDSPEARLDRIRACELAARFGLTHRLLPLTIADNAGADDWSARTGYCVGGVNIRNHPTIIRPLEGRDFFIGGVGGEIGRGFFWRPTDSGTMVVTTETIMARFGMPKHPRVRAAVDAWMPSIAGFDPFLQLDLAFLELRMSCWGCASAYANPIVKQIHPMISRESFATMLSLPPKWRRNNYMILEGVRDAWPELLELPINRYGDYRDFLRMVTRAASNPYLVLKVLRKRFG